MGHPPHLLVPESSGKALISQCKSSSSPSSSLASPSTEPSLTVSSSSDELSAHHQHLPLDLMLPSPSSSSRSLVPEVLPIPMVENSYPRGKKKQRGAHREHKHTMNMDPPVKERQKQVKQSRISTDCEKKSKGCQDNVCCKCAAGFTADCAAVCCCPLALFHLAALTFIRLPAAMAWKVLVKLKNRVDTKRRQSRDGREDSPRPTVSNPWSHGSSPEGNIDMAAHKARFDSQNLWQHFDAGRLDFGGLSMRREPQ